MGAGCRVAGGAWTLGLGGRRVRAGGRHQAQRRACPAADCRARAGANGARERLPRALLPQLARFAGALLIGLALLALWDAARSPQSFWALNAARNNPGRVIRSDELVPRLETWARWLHYVTGAPLLNLVLLAGAIVNLGSGWRSRTRAALCDWLIAIWAIAFLATHWLVAVNTYDRYLHPLVPFLLILAARGAVRPCARRMSPGRERSVC